MTGRKFLDLLTVNLKYDKLCISFIDASTAKHFFSCLDSEKEREGGIRPSLQIVGIAPLTCQRMVAEFFMAAVCNPHTSV